MLILNFFSQSQTANVRVRSHLFRHGDSNHSDGFSEVNRSSPGGVTNLSENSITATHVKHHPPRFFTPCLNSFATLNLSYQVRFSVSDRTGNVSQPECPMRVELYTPCVFAEYFGWQQMHITGAPVPAPIPRGYSTSNGYINMVDVDWGLASRAGTSAFNTTGIKNVSSQTWEAVVAATGLQVTTPLYSGGVVWIRPNIDSLLNAFDG